VSWSRRCTVTEPIRTVAVPPARAGTVAPVLVLGIGSELRSDDAAGRHVAERIGRLARPGVETRSVHQLTPELATDLVGRRLVVLVDADVEVDTVTVRHLSHAPATAGAMTHHLDPAALLGLVDLFGPRPDAVVQVGIPVHDLELGTELSPATAVAVEDAVEQVRSLVG
jgi:hydrogenase maturation protease